MSTDPPPPSDRSTEPLRPREPVVREHVAEEVIDPGLLERLEDAVRSLRTALALVGVLATVALGVAIYALTETDDGEASRDGASRERVSRLDERVDRLSRQLQRTRARDGGDAEESDLRSLQQQLERRASTGEVEQLRSSLQRLQDSAGEGGDTSALEDRVDRLAQQVEDLRNTQSP